MRPFTKNNAVAHVIEVSGYRRGLWCRWYAVYDSAGYSVVGVEGESAAAVSIRYVDTVGTPAQFVRYGCTFSPGAAVEFAEQVRGRPHGDASPRVSHYPFGNAADTPRVAGNLVKRV